MFVNDKVIIFSLFFWSFFLSGFFAFCCSYKQKFGQKTKIWFNYNSKSKYQVLLKVYGNTSPQFENIPDWDPNTKNCQVIRKNEKQVGSVYNIVTVFNGKQSVVSYQTMEFQETKNRGIISLQGKNDMITASDQITCTKKDENTTLIKYKAEISLRGVFWLFTPFIRGGLDTITQQAKNGCIKKSIQKWGNAREFKSL